MAVPPGVRNEELGGTIAGRPVVLFLDDEQDVLEALRVSLRKEPFDMIFASTVSEALRVLQQTCVHVVVSDEKMPTMSGAEFLSLVRLSFPDAVRILFTGETGLETAAKAASEAKAFGFLTKPCHAATLGAMIREAATHHAHLKSGMRVDI